MNPVEPKASDLRVEDIAHALSFLCRANGHFPQFFSVAQHSINCAREAEACGYTAKVQMACLLHDASEAYISDVTRPVKCHLPQYRIFEARLQGLVYGTFLPEPPTEAELELIDKMDDTQLYYEFLNLSGQAVFSRQPEILLQPNYACSDFPVVEKNFLDLYHQLVSGCGGIPPDRRQYNRPT